MLPRAKTRTPLGFFWPISLTRYYSLSVTRPGGETTTTTTVWIARTGRLYGPSPNDHFPLAVARSPRLWLVNYGPHCPTAMPVAPLTVWLDLSGAIFSFPPSLFMNLLLFSFYDKSLRTHLVSGIRGSTTVRWRGRGRAPTTVTFAGRVH